MPWSSQPVRCHDNAGEDTNPDFDVEANVISTFPDSIRIILRPVVNTPIRLNTFRLCTECYAKSAHPQRVGVAVNKIASVGDDSQETDVHSASSDVDAVDLHAVLGGPSVGIVPVVVLLHSSRSTALITPSSLAGVRP
jgi:hypothetical protein